MDDASATMHVDWIRLFNDWRQILQMPIEINAEQIIGGGQPLTGVNDVNVTATLTGTPLTALLKPVTITLGWTGTLSATRGGTGIGSYAVGDLLYADTTTTLARLADVAVGSLLVPGGVGVAPSWSVTPTLTGSLSIIPTIDPLNALLLQGDAANAAILAIHNSYAIGIDVYTHSNSGFRAPYMNFYKSRGTQASPTAPTLTGYEMDSIGGINFGGWSGAAYVQSAAILTQVDQNWSVGNTGAHISIYGRNNSSGSVQQIAQFGGLDPADAAALNAAGTTNNILFYRPLVWSGNSVNNPGLFYSSSPARISVKTANNAEFAALSVGPVLIAAGTIAAGTSPIKLTSGPVLTTAEAGAIEFLTDTFFATITTGAARKGIVLDNGSRLTSGSIPIATTNGRLIDGPSFPGGVLGVTSGGTGTGTAFTAGSVVFAGASGVYTQDNANLFWDDTNDALGIGTASPSTHLHVKGALLGGYVSKIECTGADLFNAFVSTSGSAEYGIFADALYFQALTTLAAGIRFYGNSGATVHLQIATSGRIGLGMTAPTAPTAQAHLSAGTATASTAPLKFTSGTNLTTAEAGAMEYNGTNLFFTRAGTVRENVLVAIDNVAAPTTSIGVAIVNYYGANATNYLGDPNRWLSVNVLGATYKIPLYT